MTFLLLNIAFYMGCPQVHKMEAESRYKLFLSNAWMKFLNFKVLTSWRIRQGISQGPSRLRDQHLAAELWQAPAGGLSVAKTESIRRQSRSETSRGSAETRKARKRAVDQIWQTYTWYLPVICTNSAKHAFRGFMTCLPPWHIYVHAGARLWW